jgi:S1-C subfamily serine protease
MSFFCLRVSAVLMLGLISLNASAQFEEAGRGGSGAARAVYKIVCPDRNRGGTAFGHRSGRVITAAHIVKDCDISQLRIIAPSGVFTGVSDLASDESLDLTIIKPSVDDFVKGPLDLNAEPQITIGAQVSIWGFPEGYSGDFPILSVGYVAGVQDFMIKPNEVSHKLIINGAINLGNSGGPLLETKTARVLGVISAKLTPMAGEFDSRLKKIQKGGSEEGKELASIIQSLRRQTQLVLGFATSTHELKMFLRKNGVEP